VYVSCVFHNACDDILQRYRLCGDPDSGYKSVLARASVGDSERRFGISFVFAGCRANNGIRVEANANVLCEEDTLLLYVSHIYGNVYYNRRLLALYQGGMEAG
jgi:hypothetical protein